MIVMTEDTFGASELVRASSGARGVLLLLQTTPLVRFSSTMFSPVPVGPE